MKKYENIEIEISAINVDDVITASTVIKIQDSGVDTPWMKLNPDGEIH